MTTRFVCSGGLRADYLITQNGRTYNGMVGGNALYAAVGAALWSNDVGVWARHGENFPQAWLAPLPQLGIATDGLVTIPGDQDHRTFFAYTPDGQRVDTDPARHYGRIGQPLPQALHGYVHSTPGQDNPDEYEPLALRPGDWPAAFAQVTAVHLAPLSLCTHRHVPPVLRQHGVATIILDPGERYMVPAREKYVRELLPQIDAFLPSDMEIRSLFGDDADLDETVARLHDWGSPVVVIKLGAEGVLVSNGRSQQRLSAFHAAGNTAVVDVTGAGDSFCGGFMVGLAQTGDPLRAAQMGLVSASLVIEGYGARYALSRRGEAGPRLAQLGDRQ